MDMREDEIPCPSCDRALAPDAESCAGCGASTLLFGRFLLRGVLGQGGMGRVFSALDTQTLRLVAIKSQHLSGFDSFKNQEMLERSARILEHLNHPGLPRVLAYGALEGGRFVLVRESFDGQTLTERLRHTPLKAEKLRALLKRLLEILVELQDHVPPVIHRDIKPANIMFRTLTDWAPVLVDFDTVADLGGRAGMTMVGTPGYMAPEVLAGDASPASDVYSMGATMLEVITRVGAGELLREGGGMRFDVDRCLSGVEPTLRRVISRMVEPDRRDRYTRARDALEDIFNGPTEAFDLALAPPVGARAEKRRPDPRSVPRRVAAPGPERRSKPERSSDEGDRYIPSRIDEAEREDTLDRIQAVPVVRKSSGDMAGLSQVGGLIFSIAVLVLVLTFFVIIF